MKIANARIGGRSTIVPQTSYEDFTMPHQTLLHRGTFLLAALFAFPVISFAADPAPLKALLVTGGCCHDYGKQKEVLQTGLKQRVNIEIKSIHTTDTTTKARFEIYENSDWAKGYDVIIHDECTSHTIDQPYVDNILNAHKGGVAAVNLHCAMHSYRIPSDEWFKFVGIQSSGHGPQKPIDVTYLDRSHAITKGLDNWTTINEELYNNVLKVNPFESSIPLARGRQDTGKQVDDYVVAWANTYGKCRVFSTTLGHNTGTVADNHYLDFVARGLLWSVGKLSDDGKPAEGYAGTGIKPIDIDTLKPEPDPKASAK